MELIGSPTPHLGRQASAEIDLGQELTDGFAIRYIRLKARQLVFTGRIPAGDRQDIEQDLAVALLERAGRFDPARAHWNAFVATVLERQVATLLEARRTQKRRPQVALVSLSTRVPGEDDGATELAHLVEPTRPAGLTRASADEEQLLSLCYAIECITSE